MQEYLDFLGKQSPYDRLDGEDLSLLARTVEVEFFASGATIVHANGPQLDHLYIVRTGSVHVVDRGREVDELVPGDTFGHISLLSGLPPPLSVVAVTETLCYRIPDPRTLLQHSERLTFAHYNTMVGRPRMAGSRADSGLRPVSDFMRDPLWCLPDTPIHEAAAQMSAANQSCALFRGPDGLGIMTDSDCRRFVATGLVSHDAPVSLIGTVPARSVAEAAPASTAFVEMVTHGVHHLVVVDPVGVPVGVTRVLDLSSVEIRDPLIVRNSIDRATTLQELAEASRLLQPTAVELFDAGVPATRTGALIAAMVEAIVLKCISFEPEFAKDRALEASWMVLGSLARCEPLPWSDVDTAIVWAGRDGSSVATNDVQPFLEPAERVIANFETCGLRRCADGANASNPLFNRSREAWLQSTRRWVAEPDADGSLLLSSMVTDSRSITHIELGRSLTGALDRPPKSRRFLKRMLDEALAARPPTGLCATSWSRPTAGTAVNSISSEEGSVRSSRSDAGSP